MNSYLLFILTLLFFFSCSRDCVKEPHVIIVVPVYGQSLALGQEANLVTNFDTLKAKFNHRILTQNLDENFGYFSTSVLIQNFKGYIHFNRKTSEISSYGLGEYILSNWKRNKAKNNLLFCTFPGGQGGTGIDYLGKGSKPYNKLINEIKEAFNKAKDSKSELIVPALCWLQGESDIADNTAQGYKNKLTKFRNDLDADVKQITGQKCSLKIILYQSTCLSISKDTFRMNMFNIHQTIVPQAQLELIRENRYFVASGPTYPYAVAREYVHIDGVSQKRLGYLEGVSLSKLLCSKKHIGLIPNKICINGHSIIISFHISCPPLVFDTTMVAKIDNYGFSVITPNNRNILKNVRLVNNKVYLNCLQIPDKVKVRYAVNGSYNKSGNLNGPRGNLRDSQGESIKCHILDTNYRIDNWCYMFDEVLKRR